MALVITGTRNRSPGRSLDQEQHVRDAIASGETVFVEMNGVRFETEIGEGGKVVYRPLLRSAG